jgi:aminocarboxymuconate-semialdehyde decarboxylase
LDNKVDPINYLGKFWVDSLVHDADALDFLIKKVGESKIALGTDYPFPLGELEPGNLIESSNYSDQKKNKLLFENALDWLGLSHDHFK